MIVIRRKSLLTLLVSVLLLSLMAAACSPASTSGTPAGPATLPGVAITTPGATGHPTSLPRSVTTPAATSVATSASTQAPTSGPTKAATSEASAKPTVAGTANPNATTNPQAPLLIESDKLLGMQIVDTQGKQVGPVVDVVVDSIGIIHALVVNASGYLANLPASATSTAAATQTAATTTIPAAQTSDIAIGFTEFKPDTTKGTLVYLGNQLDLQYAPRFDETKIGAGYVIRSQATHLPPQFDSMLRLGGKLSDVSLETPANQKLGDLQHVILDLRTGQALYGVVNFGGFLGVGQRAVAVPWTMFKVDNTDKTTTAPVVRLSVTQANLKAAPSFDDSQLNLWPTPAQPNWDNQYQKFWNKIAGS